MSITDELRKWAEGDTLRAGMSLRTARDQALAIADRIDAEHESEISRAAQLLADAEKDRDFNYANWQDCKQKVLQHNIMIDELDAEIERLKDELAHCIELPVDADGEYIHIGDELECIEALHPEVPARFKVQDMFYRGNGEWRLRAYPATYDPKKCRHHHAPTVEDVLRDFAEQYAFYSAIEGGIHPDLKAHDEVLRRFAAKLQLREDA